MDISQASNIVILVDDREHKAEFLEKGRGGEIIFKILERDHPYIKTKSGHRCQVFMTEGTGREAKKFFFEGKISSEYVDKASVWASTPIMQDRRKEVRYNIVPILALLEEKRFLRVRMIQVNIINISRSGACLHTNIPLTVNNRYKLDTKFRTRHSLEPFSAEYLIRYCMKRGEIYLNLYICGGEFEKFSILPEHMKTLDKFLASLQS